jgi:hypothetical protein
MVWGEKGELTMLRRVLTLALAVLFLLVVAVPASAKAPVAKFTDEFDFVVPSADSGCDFDFLVVGTDKIQVRAFDMTEIISHNQKATLTNLDNGQSLDDNGTWKDTLTFDGDGNLVSIDTTGSIFRITIPGQGIVVQDTGKIVFDPETGDVFSEAGPHEAFHDGFDICTLLGGNALP